MKVINIFFIFSIFTFVDATHAMDHEYDKDKEYRLDFSQKSPRSIGGLISEDIVRYPHYERKTVKLENITPEKFELLLDALLEAVNAGGVRKIVYSYDESLLEMPRRVDKLMSIISSKKRIIIEKEGLKKWSDERAPELAKVNNEDAKTYQEDEKILDNTEFINFAIENRFGDSGHSDTSSDDSY